MQGRINDPSIFQRVLSNITPHTACERKKRLKLYGTHDDAGTVEHRVVFLTLEVEMISSQDSFLEQTHSYNGRASIVSINVAYAYKQLSKLLKNHFLFRLFLKFEKYSLFDGGKSEYRCTHPRLDFVTR